MTKQVNRGNNCIVYEVIRILYDKNKLIISQIGNYTNQSYSATSNILNVLIRAKLVFIEEINNKKLYRLTTKGQEFYKHLQAVNEDLPEVFF